jgi:hypothetical protein
VFCCKFLTLHDSIRLAAEPVVTTAVSKPKGKGCCIGSVVIAFVTLSIDQVKSSSVLGLLVVLAPFLP